MIVIPLFTIKCIWAAFVLVCVLVNGWTLREALIDKHIVMRRTQNRAYHIRAWQAVRDEFVTFAFQFFLLGIRLWAIFWPAPSDPYFRMNWSIDATVITVLQCFLAFNCLLDLRDRRRSVTEFDLHLARKQGTK